MNFDLVLPDVNRNNVNSKNAIISLLAFEQPLTAKKIHSELKRRHALIVSYQATHKNLSELIQKKIIQKKDKNYQLSLEWINSLKKFTEGILLQQNSLTLLEVINKQESNLFFEDLASVDRFLLSSAEAITTQEKKPLYMYWFHSWTPLFFSKEGYSKIRALAEKAELFVLIKGDTALDKWCGQALKKFGQHNFKTGIKDLSLPEFLVYQDYVFQVFYPKKIIEEVNKEFNKIKKVEDLDVDKLFNKVFEKKIGIPAVVNKNPLLAEQLKKKVEDYFK